MLAVTNCEPAVEHERAGEAGRDPLGGRDRVAFAGDVVQQQAELVAAEARDRVGRPDGLAESRRDARQQLVAGVVPERVVDLLEVIEVDEQDGRE